LLRASAKAHEKFSSELGWKNFLVFSGPIYKIISCVFEDKKTEVGNQKVALPCLVWILSLAHLWKLENLPVHNAVDMISWFLPNSKIILLFQFFPAKASGHIFNHGLLCFQIFACSVPAFPVFLPVYRRPGQDPIPTRTQNSINFD
jgi:hypothetical protein